MKILITGNMGYIGPCLVHHFREHLPGATVVGWDMEYFANCLTNSNILPECSVDVQHFGDIRKMKSAILKEIDAVVRLSATSNDPMGNTFEAATRC